MTRPTPAARAYAAARARARATAGNRRPSPTARTARRLAARLARGVYDGTEQSRQTADWTPGRIEPQALTAEWLELLRNRSRSLARTASHVVSAFTAIKDNVIGSDGFRLRPRPLSGQAGDPEGIDEQLARQLAVLWTDHSAAIDIDRRESFTDLLRTALGEYPEGGEIFVVEATPPRDDPNGVIPQVLELVPAERCDHSLSTPVSPVKVAAGNKITNGIEFDRVGRRVAYHFAVLDAYGVPSYQTNRVGADRVYHLFHRLRAGQERGLPWLYPSTMLAHDLDDLIDSELTSSQVAACLAAFVKTESGAGVFEGDTNTERDDDDQRPILGLDPGMVAYLEPGEDIATVKPDRPGGQFEPFASFIVRQLAKSLGPGYETVSGDYRRVNFASGRLAHLVERKAYRRIQAITTNLIVRPVYRSFVRRAVLAGAVPIDPVEYLANPRRFDRVDIQPPGWEHHDPLKEATAAALRILVGISTLDEEAASLGRDWRTVIDQRRQEVAAMETAGLPLFGVGGATPIAGMTGANSSTRLAKLAGRLGFASAAELIGKLEDGAVRSYETNGDRLKVLQELHHAVPE